MRFVPDLTFAHGISRRGLADVRQSLVALWVVDDWCGGVLGRFQRVCRSASRDGVPVVSSETSRLKRRSALRVLTSLSVDMAKESLGLDLLSMACARGG